MKTMLTTITAVCALAAGIALGQSGPEVLKSKGCLNCHETDKKKVGPSFKDIAAKHRDAKGDESKLVDKLRTGKGHPKTSASDAELHAAVQEILSTK